MPLCLARRFAIADGMILVALAAVALAWSLGCRRELDPLLGELPSLWRTPYDVAALAIPFLGLGSLALLALRLRAPRPGRRRLWAEPGFLVSVASLFSQVDASTFEAMRFVASRLRPSTGIVLYLGPPSPFLLARRMVGMAAAVAVLWPALALGVRWRASRDWVDRSARILGACWIGLYAAYLVITAFE